MLRAGLAILTLAVGASAGAQDGSIAFLGRTDRYWQVWTVDADGEGLQQVTHSRYEKARATWFPDRQSLLIVPLEAGLVRIDLESRQEERLDVGLQGIHDAAVSPDGSRLAVSALTGPVQDNHDIWLIELVGGAKRRLVSMPWLQHEPRWSADGKSIVFLSGDGQQNHDIWRVDAETGSREQLTVGARYHFEVDVASDGTLAFSSNRTGDYEIYTQRRPGARAVRWTRSPGLDGHPAWSPDGKSLVYHSTRSGRLNLWRQDGPNSPAYPLTDLASGARAPEWWGPIP